MSLFNCSFPSSYVPCKRIINESVKHIMKYVCVCKQSSKIVCLVSSWEQSDSYPGNQTEKSSTYLVSEISLVLNILSTLDIMTGIGLL